MFESFLNDNFKKWFGDSKVVDDKGNPMVMYHGSPHIDDIKEFKNTKGYNFFTSSENEASRYTGGVAGSYYGDVHKVGKFYIKALNPFDPTKMSESELESISKLFKDNPNIIKTISEDMVHEVIENFDWYWDNDYNSKLKPIEILYEKGYSDSDILIVLITKSLDNYILLENETVQEWIISNGYDSFITLESGGGDFNIAVYNANQIKSVNNNGNYSDSSNVFESK